MPYGQQKRQVLSSFEDTRNAVTQLAAGAERMLSIYTPDLEPGIYDDEQFLEVVKRLVLSKRYARVRVLISKPSRTNRNGNRLVALGRRLNTYIEFRNVDEKFREKHQEAYLIADDNALLFRASSGKWEGIAGTHEPQIAGRQLEIFDEIWDASEFIYEQPEARAY
jgi:hypothetical protein